MAEEGHHFAGDDDIIAATERPVGAWWELKTSLETPSSILQSGGTKSEMGLSVENVVGFHRGDGREDESVGLDSLSLHHGRHSPVASVLSMTSGQSMDLSFGFTGEGPQSTRAESLSSEFPFEEDNANSSQSQHTAEPGDVLCSVCPKRAFKSCRTCIASFCEIHVKQHYSAPALQRHKLAEATKDLEQRLCQQHHRQLELYCKTDQTAICVLCVAKGHSGHDITEVEENISIPVPQNVTVGSVTPTSADLSWSLRQGMEQIPHSFLISYHSEGTEPQTIPTQSCSTTLTGLQPDTQYTVSVCCELKDGRRSQATTTSVKTGDFVPAGLTVNELNEEPYSKWSADLSWSLHLCMEQIPHSFLITYHSEVNEPKTISTALCNTTLTDLQPETQYTVSIRTVLQDGKESQSTSTTFHTSERRIVLLGRSGDGKSSTGNTILDAKVFEVNMAPDSQTKLCETHSQIINGRKYTVTDTPGFFDIDKYSNDLTPAIVKCIFDSCPGPHAVVIVMRVGRFTEQEQQVVKKITELFAKDTFKHAVILFTYGRELKGQSIEQFVEKSKNSQSKATLKAFVDRCDGRFHVIDNEHWNQEGGKSQNTIHLKKLFETIDEIVQANEGCYTNDFFLLVWKAIQKEMDKIRECERELSDREIRAKAHRIVEQRVLINECAAKFSVLVYAAFSFNKIPNGFLSRYAPRAAATTECACEAAKEAHRLFRLLLQE